MSSQGKIGKKRRQSSKEEEEEIIQDPKSKSDLLSFFPLFLSQAMNHHDGRLLKPKILSEKSGKISQTQRRKCKSLPATMESTSCSCMWRRKGTFWAGGFRHGEAGRSI